MFNNKIIIFDWGGVIESHCPKEYNINKCFISLAKRCGSNLSDEKIINVYYNMGYIEDIEIGTVNDTTTLKRWVEILCSKLEISSSFQNFIKIYQEEFAKVHYYKDVVDYIKSLKKKCMIGILSNLNKLDKDRLDKQVKLQDFDYVWLSFELELKKPDNKIYEKVINDLQMKPNTILFLDDSLENVNAAKKLGINAVEVRGYELDKIKEAVEKFLSD